MKLRQASTFRLESNIGKRIKMAQTARCVHLVWNKALAEQKARLESGQKIERYHQLLVKLTGWTREESFAFLPVPPSHPLQHCLRMLDRAFSDAFRCKGDAGKKGFPRFKKGKSR